jgi:hypothetical protein
VKVAGNNGAAGLDSGFLMNYRGVSVLEAKPLSHKATFLALKDVADSQCDWRRSAGDLT